MNNAFRVLGFASLLTVGFSGLASLGGCGANKSSGLHRDAGSGDGGAGGTAGTGSAGAAGHSSDGERADGAAPDSGAMGGTGSGGTTGTGSADAARLGDAGGTTALDASIVDLGSRADLGIGGKDAAGSGDAGGTGTGGTGGGGSGGVGGTGAGGTGGGTGTGGSGGPSCPSDLPSGAASTFCVGNVLHEGVSACHDGGCTCVAGRHVTCLNECVKNAADSGGSCSGGFLMCPEQGGSMRRSICFLGGVYSVMSACSTTAGCNCKISQSKKCTGACVELADGSAECQ